MRYILYGSDGNAKAILNDYAFSRALRPGCGRWIAPGDSKWKSAKSYYLFGTMPPGADLTVGDEDIRVVIREGDFIMEEV